MKTFLTLAETHTPVGSRSRCTGMAANRTEGRIAEIQTWNVESVLARRRIQPVRVKRIFAAGVTLALAIIIAAATTSSDVQCARAILAASAQAYKNVAALHDMLSYVVEAPDSPRETKTQDYEFGPGKTVRVRNALLDAVGANGEFCLVQSDVPDRYVYARYEGDFGTTLRRVAGSGSLFEPPPLAMHEGKDLEACIDTLRFNLLEPLRIAGCQEDVAGDNGKSYDEVRFAADNGELALRIDRHTHFFESVSFQVKPAGSPDGFVVRVNGTFSPKILSGSDAAIAFVPGSRSAVSNLTELTTRRLAIGSPAPDFELETLDGKKIALADLRGSFVLLDFWATWCVPCWKALQETEAISDWTEAKQLPVKIFAINTLEQGDKVTEKLERVRKFWRSQGFRMPALFDADSTTFKSFANPGLPSVVLISPAGTILRYHEGLFPDMKETLKRELQDSLQANAR